MYMEVNDPSLSFIMRKICIIFGIHVMEARIHNMKLNLVYRRIVNLKKKRKNLYFCVGLGRK